MWLLKRKATSGENNSSTSSAPQKRQKTFPSGIKLLHDSRNSIVDIIFVHGLTGDREKTWKAKGAASPWPQTLLPAEIDNARILTFGYDAYVADWKGMVSKNRIADHSINLLSAVSTYREKDDTNDRPIVFVCHSLGGLVCEDALVEASQRPEDHLRRILVSTCGIVFLGTPHHGSGLAQWAEKLARSIGVLKQTNPDILAVLKTDSEVLARIQRSFHVMIRSRSKEGLDPIEITCFYEELPLPGVDVVVPSHSAILPGYIPLGIRNNHMDMTKFEDGDDPGFEAVVGELRRWIKGLDMNRRRKEQEQRRWLLESLRFDQIDARHMTIKNAHTETCEWLLQNSEYCDWLDDTKLDEHYGFLWIKGKPGAGKSTLMKYALTSAQGAMWGRIIISFFFNARGVDLENSTLGTYQSLLLQLLEARPGLQCVFDSLYLSTSLISTRHQWTVESLKTLLEQAIRKLEHDSVICFVDALDECEENQIRDMISFFEQIGRVSRRNKVDFRICFSSRHYPHITIRQGLSLVLEGQEGHTQDITNYLNSELKIGYNTVAQQIRTELQEKASGVFMWIILVVAILNKEYDCGRMHALRRRLREIPPDLYQLFRDILMRDTNKRKELVLCIQWVLLARQPLSPPQLYFAILSGVEPLALSSWNPDEISMGDIHRFILDCSKGLVEVTKSVTQTAQFIHESVREFFLKENGLGNIIPELGGDSQGQSHEQLKDCCLTYMRLDISKDKLLKRRMPKTLLSYPAGKCRTTTTELFPFLEYAVRNILYHADVAARFGIAEKAFLQTFPLSDWITLNNILAQSGGYYTQNGNLLDVLEELDLPNLIRNYRGSSGTAA